MSDDVQTAARTDDTPAAPAQAPAAAAAQTPAGPARTDTAAEPSGDGATARARKEAASYRQRLRDTEAERDLLRDRLTEARRSLLRNAKPVRRRIREDAVEDALAELDARQVNELFNDGGMDEQALGKLVDSILERRPYMRRPVEYDHDAVRTALLAENPQGAVNPDAGVDPLRRALHRS